MTHPNYSHIGAIEDKLIEELSELIKAICKARRFGYEGINPLKPEEGTNLRQITDEMCDVMDRLVEYNDFLEEMETM